MTQGSEVCVLCVCVLSVCECVGVYVVLSNTPASQSNK